VLHDDQIRPRADNPRGLTQDDLNQPRILADLGCQLLRLRRRHDGGEIDSTALCLRHDLLRHHHDIALAQFPAAQRSDDQRGDVMALADHRNAGQRHKFECGTHAGGTVIVMTS
jgi:hypothetical protein